MCDFFFFCMLYWHAADYEACTFHRNSKMCCQCRLLKILKKMSMTLWQNVWTTLCVYLYMYLSVAGAGTATWLYVSSQGVSGWAKLCCTFSHIILLPPFSVLTVPPEREYARLLSECVSVYVGVCAWHAVSLHFLFQVIWGCIFAACSWQFGGVSCLAGMWKQLSVVLV